MTIQEQVKSLPIIRRHMLWTDFKTALAGAYGFEPLASAPLTVWTYQFPILAFLHQETGVMVAARSAMANGGELVLSQVGIEMAWAEIPRLPYLVSIDWVNEDVSPVVGYSLDFSAVSTTLRYMDKFGPFVNWGKSEPYSHVLATTRISSSGEELPIFHNLQQEVMKLSHRRLRFML